MAIEYTVTEADLQKNAEKRSSVVYASPYSSYKGDVYGVQLTLERRLEEDAQKAKAAKNLEASRQQQQPIRMRPRRKTAA